MKIKEECKKCQDYNVGYNVGFSEGFDKSRTQRDGEWNKAIGKILEEEQHYPNGILYTELIAKRINTDFKLGFDKYLMFAIMKLNKKLKSAMRGEQK